MDCRYKEKCRNYCGRCDENTCYLALKEINKELQKENAELKSRLEKSVELPCKVGDILYTNIGYKYSRLKNRPFSCEVVFIGLNYKYSILNVVYQDGSMEQFNSYDIGKTVFLTREEAEQALKEREENE